MRLNVSRFIMTINQPSIGLHHARTRAPNTSISAKIMFANAIKVASQKLLTFLVLLTPVTSLPKSSKMQLISADAETPSWCLRRSSTAMDASYHHIINQRQIYLSIRCSPKIHWKSAVLPTSPEFDRSQIVGTEFVCFSEEAFFFSRILLSQFLSSSHEDILSFVVQSLRTGG